MLRSLPAPRALPAAVAVAALLLILKLGAMIAEPRPPGPASLSLIAPAAAAGGASSHGGKDASKGNDHEEGKAEDAKRSVATADAPGETDRPAFTASEVEILQQLRQRREALDSREQELGRREDLLKAATARIDQRVNELSALKSDIERLIQAQDAQNEEKLLSLVRIYENMKPADAARIFEELDLHTLLSVAERMKERKLAPILAEMKPVKARDVTVELARLKALIGNGAKAEGGKADAPSPAKGGAAAPAAGRG